MTLVLSLLIGAGVLFIASAIDDVSIMATFQSIIRGDAIGTSTTGTSATTSTQPTQQTPPPTTLV